MVVNVMEPGHTVLYIKSAPKGILEVSVANFSVRTEVCSHLALIGLKKFFKVTVDDRGNQVAAINALGEEIRFVTSAKEQGKLFAVGSRRRKDTNVPRRSSSLGPLTSRGNHIIIPYSILTNRHLLGSRRRWNQVADGMSFA